MPTSFLCQGELETLSQIKVLIGFTSSYIVRFQILHLTQKNPNLNTYIEVHSCMLVLIHDLSIFTLQQSSDADCKPSGLHLKSAAARHVRGSQTTLPLGGAGGCELVGCAARQRFMQFVSWVWPHDLMSFAWQQNNMRPENTHCSMVTVDAIAVTGRLTRSTAVMREQLSTLLDSMALWWQST